MWRDVSGTVGGGGSNGRWTVVSSDRNQCNDFLNFLYIFTLSHAKYDTNYEVFNLTYTNYNNIVYLYLILYLVFTYLYTNYDNK